MKASETRINSIIENILDGMITVDEQGVICSMNPAAEKMFGCINNEMVGHNFTKLVPKTYGPEPELKQIPIAWTDLAQQHRQHHHGGRSHPPARDLPDRNFAQRNERSMDGSSSSR